MGGAGRRGAPPRPSRAGGLVQRAAMATHWTLGCDAADPQRIVAFWARALRYVAEPGFDRPDNASIVDPEGRLTDH